jgi:hypothetical protein
VFPGRIDADCTRVTGLVPVDLMVIFCRQAGSPCHVTTPGVSAGPTPHRGEALRKPQKGPDDDDSTLRRDITGVATRQWATLRPLPRMVEVLGIVDNCHKGPQAFSWSGGLGSPPYIVATGFRVFRRAGSPLCNCGSVVLHRESRRGPPCHRNASPHVLIWTTH